MRVRLLNATDDPEELICRGARNDYMSGWVAEQDFEEAMEGVEGNDIEEQKANFLAKLLQRGHYGPFEHPSATFAIEGMSRSCMAQLTRHRHASFDVQSMRYVAFDEVDPTDVEEGEMVVTPPSATDPDWIGRNQKNVDVDAETVEKREELFQQSVRQSVEDYQELLELGMPPEDARFVLPIGTEVNVVVTLNPRSLMHIADMRAAADAQWEIRELTEQLLDLAAEWCPHTFDYYEAEMKHRKNRLAP